MVRFGSGSEGRVPQSGAHLVAARSSWIALWIRRLVVCRCANEEQLSASHFSP